MLRFYYPALRGDLPPERPMVKFRKGSKVLALMLGCGLGILGLWSHPGQAAEVQVRLQPAGEGLFLKKVQSWRERRFRKVITQRVDFSCGAAALATVLHYQFGYPIGEREAILGMFRYGNRQEIRQRGFSMLEMKDYVDTLHLKATGFRYGDVAHLEGKKFPPLITIITTRQYKHFVVIRRVAQNMVYISDPALGNRAIPVEDFNQNWIHILFLVTGPVKGTPEGLFAGDIYRVPKAGVLPLVTNSNLWNPLAMDPSFAIFTFTKIPIVDWTVIGIGVR
jgi:predicted double-glycine peptidase